jgi:hypothetical protein
MTVHYLSLREFSERAKMTYKAMEHRWQRGRLPAPDVTVGLSPGWCPEVVDAWIEEQA